LVTLSPRYLSPNKKVRQQDAYPPQKGGLQLCATPHSTPFQGQQFCRLYSTHWVENDGSAKLPNLPSASCDLTFYLLSADPRGWPLHAFSPELLVPIRIEFAKTRAVSSALKLNNFWTVQHRGILSAMEMLLSGQCMRGSVAWLRHCCPGIATAHLARIRPCKPTCNVHQVLPRCKWETKYRLPTVLYKAVPRSRKLEQLDPSISAVRWRIYARFSTFARKITWPNHTTFFFSISKSIIPPCSISRNWVQLWLLKSDIFEPLSPRKSS